MKFSRREFITKVAAAVAASAAPLPVLAAIEPEKVCLVYLTGLDFCMLGPESKKLFKCVMSEINVDAAWYAIDPKRYTYTAAPNEAMFEFDLVNDDYRWLSDPKVTGTIDVYFAASKWIIRRKEEAAYGLLGKESSGRARYRQAGKAIRQDRGKGGGRVRIERGG